MKNLLTNSLFRSTLITLILILTTFLFVRFFVMHPQYWAALSRVRPSALMKIFGLNVLLILVLAVIYDFTLRLCNTRLNWKEQFLLTSYSAIANFFGPFQSGPGVRAIYLKTKHGVRIRDYSLMTIIYYVFFALFNALFLFGLTILWWQTLIAIFVVGTIGSVIAWQILVRRKKSIPADGLQLRLSLFVGLIVATLIQVSLLALCYFIEVQALDATVTLRQALIYSGAANFALFVSLTPDAIGFRESFLILSRSLHRIGTPIIIAANVIDRAVYVVFLGVLFLVVLATHTRDRFKVDPAQVEVASQ